eukprot:502186_1
MASDKMEMESEDEDIDDDIIMDNENKSDKDEQIARRLQQQEKQRYEHYHSSYHRHDSNDNHNRHKSPLREIFMSDDDILLTENEDEQIDLKLNEDDVMIQNQSTNKIILRYYQKEAINALLEIDDTRMQCIMPCGTGKTIVMLNYLLRQCIKSR